MDFNATFIVAFFSFIIFMVIMNQILYKPIGEIVEKRKKLIEDNYNTAHENQEKSKAILEDRLDKLKNARNLVREKNSEAVEKIKEKRQQLEKNAKDEANSRIEENINALNNDEKEASDKLKQYVINLAQTISDKFIETPNRIENVDIKQIENMMQD